TAAELKADLIVMGSHGRKGFQRMLLGSFAQDVLSNTALPVLIVKA
ncbi:MAG: universal stress protein, partial [Acinetobacter sp.]|nr:universal stress protein [Acinetobacter sp.]